MSTNPNPDVPPLTVTRDEVRQLDALAISQCGINSLVLMENAARGLVDAILAHSPTRIVFLCGPGNNGGDGLAAARILASSDRPTEVRLVTAGKQLSNDASCNLEILNRCGVDAPESAPEQLSSELKSLQTSDLIVDCLLGTGIRGAIRAPWEDVVNAANRSPAPILAADLPSGLDCDTGCGTGACIEARQTVTFAALKKGFLNPDAQRYTGTVTLAHIGMPAQWVRRTVLGLRETADRKN